jgi:IS1 family transposase
LRINGITSNLFRILIRHSFGLRMSKEAQKLKAEIKKKRIESFRSKFSFYALFLRQNLAT